MPTILEQDDDPIVVDWEKLQYYKRKSVRVFMHATALTDYIRENKIPRGLRVQKPPGMFQDDENFKNRWAAILNQCSRDLMILIIEKSKEETANLKEEITKMQEEFKTTCTTEVYDKKIQELESSLREFTAKTKEIKLKKFQRDRKDYSQNRVYNWLFEKKKVSWADPIQAFSDQDTSDVDTSDGSGDEAGPSRGLRSRTLQQRTHYRDNTNNSFSRRGRRGKYKT